MVDDDNQMVGILSEVDLIQGRASGNDDALFPSVNVAQRVDGARFGYKSQQSTTSSLARSSQPAGPRRLIPGCASRLSTLW